MRLLIVALLLLAACGPPDELLPAEAAIIVDPVTVKNEPLMSERPDAGRFLE